MATKKKTEEIIKLSLSSDMMDISLRPVLAEVERMLKDIDIHFFDGELAKRVVITLQRDTTKGAYGYATNGNVWGTAYDSTKEEQEYTLKEVGISVEYLYRGAKEIFETVLHELCHIYDSEHGIKDTSNNGWFHNAKYKATAESHGLVCEKTEKYGWASTKLSDEAERLFNDGEYGEIELFRARNKKNTSKKKGHSYKYTCPRCGASVRGTKSGLHIACIECSETYDELVEMYEEEC